MKNIRIEDNIEIKISKNYVDYINSLNFMVKRISDILLNKKFVNKANDCLENIKLNTEDQIIIVGLPTYSNDKTLLNSAVVILNNQIMVYHSKVLLPTYDVFDEDRYFNRGKINSWSRSRSFCLGNEKIRNSDRRV